MLLMISFSLSLQPDSISIDRDKANNEADYEGNSARKLVGNLPKAIAPTTINRVERLPFVFTNPWDQWSLMHVLLPVDSTFVLRNLLIHGRPKHQSN